MNYIDNNFYYTDPLKYDQRSQKPIEKYVKSLWDPILLNVIKKNVSGAVVCDLGSGTFEHVQYMEKAKKIYAVEINKNMIKTGLPRIKHFKKKIKILCQDALANSVPSSSCDIIWSVGLSEFVPIEKLFQEISRIAKPDCRLIIQFPNFFHPYNFLASIIFRLMGKPIKKYRSLWEFKLIAERFNFKLETFSSTAFFGYVPESAQFYFIPLWKILNRLTLSFQKFFPLGVAILGQFRFQDPS